MPTYDYVCTACGTRVEVIHGVNESGPTVCTECGGTLRKAMSAPAIVFKGSGWAKKDARASSGSHGGSADKDAKAAAAKGDATGGTSASKGASSTDASAAKAKDSAVG